MVADGGCALSHVKGIFQQVAVSLAGLLGNLWLLLHSSVDPRVFQAGGMMLRWLVNLQLPEGPVRTPPK